jgi:hypothetical protein
MTAFDASFAERDDRTVAMKIKDYFGDAPAAPFVGIVLGRIVGVQEVRVPTAFVLVNGVGHGNCFFTAIVTGPLTAGLTRYVFRYCFETLDCHRITATTRTTNGLAIHTMRRLGFKYEGILRGYYRGKDAAVYGLLRNDQRIVRL